MIEFDISVKLKLYLILKKRGGEKMIRVYKTAFITSRRNLDRLFECNRLSAQVWNDCLKLTKEHYKQSGRWMNKTELQKRTKGRYPIHSQSIQAVVHKYLWARDAARKARQQGVMTARYPYRQKKYFNTRWAKDGFRIYNNGKIELSLGTWQGKRQEPVTVWVKKIPEEKVKEIELIYDRKLMLCLVYDDGVEPEVNHHLSTAAIDLGEIHAISSVSENSEGIIITGRKLRSMKRLRNKKLAELQRKMKKCKKGSRQWKKYNKAKRSCQKPKLN
jgi:putative transposase